MQKLHLVGFTTELDGLILSTRKGAKSGGYVIALDDKTVASIQEAARRRNGGAPDDPPAGPAAGPGGRHLPVPAKPPKPTSALSPREIQARLRAGASVDEVAAAAGVDDEWVLRFATPIRAEQARVVDRALRLAFTKARLGLSSLPLGASVKANLSERGIRLHDDVFDEGWSAYNLHGTTWAVEFAFVNRSRARKAVWQVDLRQGEVTARGRLASDLGYVEPGRKPPKLESLEPEPAAVPAPDRAGGGRATLAPAKVPPARPAKRGAASSKERGVAVADERPTHLARPPSPMSSANRAPLQPGRLAGAPSLRPAPPALRRAAARPARPPEPPPAPPPALSPPPEPATRAEPAAEGFKPKPPPARPARSTPRRVGRSAPVRPVPTIPAMAAPSVIEVGHDDPEPAVVVLSSAKKQRRGRARDR